MLYPSVYSIHEKISKKDFYCQRLSVASWVHNEKIVNKIITGEYDKILPLHIEVCSTYICNFNCPWCSCRTSMNNGRNISMKYSDLKTIVLECHKNNIGIQWTGGEPLVNPHTISAIEFADSLNVKQCLFTNGSLLNKDYADLLLKTNLSFIRISLNCIDNTLHSKNHGDIDSALSQNVLNNIKYFCRKKSQVDTSVQLGLSIVLNDITIEDIYNTIEFVIELDKEFKNSINYIVIRPVNLDICSISALSRNFAEKYHEFLSSDELKKLKQNGVNVVLPNADAVINIANGKCLGCNMFSEISPLGDIFMCSDKYGDMNYKIGNVFENNINEIFVSKDRYDTLQRNANCYKNSCPRFSRGSYFNSIFNQVEKCKKEGNIQLFIDWVEQLKQLITPAEHTFFI